MSVHTCSGVECMYLMYVHLCTGVSVHCTCIHTYMYVLIANIRKVSVVISCIYVPSNLVHTPTYVHILSVHTILYPLFSAVGELFV